MQNVGGEWTGIALAADSHVHFRAVQLIANSGLAKYLKSARAERDYAWALHFPSPEDWEIFDVQRAVRNLAARMYAPSFVGHPTCRDERFLKFSIDYPVDLLTAAFTIRIFPLWAQSIIAPFLPARHRVLRKVKSLSQLIKPLIEEHADVVKRIAAGEEVDEEVTVLNWMIDNSTEEENRIDKVATRLALVTAAGTHTTTGAISHIIFDLCAFPEWISVLREEVETVTKELGPIELVAEDSLKQWLQRLEKLDSFIVESERKNPQLLLAPQRVAMEPLNLKDGTYIPKGARICWAGNSHHNDPLVTPNPAIFDPVRSYMKRHSSPDQMNKHLAGQTGLDHLSFGYGKLACPGRYLAINQMKLVVSRFIMSYDFKFPDNITSRPQTLDADEFTFLDPSAKIMLRLRRDL